MQDALDVGRAEISNQPVFPGLPEGPGIGSGKVRDWISLGDGTRLLVASDRISAFDRIVGLVPWKGQVLNQLSAWWNGRTSDIIQNHLISIPDPNASIVREARPLAVEVIVRGYITGVTSTSLWRRYEQGEREIYGYKFPEGLRKNLVLPEPIITPTTKAEAGMHDERLTREEVVSKGIVAAKTWKEIERAALALFARGSELALDAGIILVDTKYEFGLDESGDLILIDEIHTPDSSRFWNADTYVSRLERGEEPESLDKEFVRLKYAALGYSGDGAIPELPPSVWKDASELYVRLFEKISGEKFVPGETPVETRLARNLSKAGIAI